MVRVGIDIINCRHPFIDSRLASGNWKSSSAFTPLSHCFDPDGYRVFWIPNIKEEVKKVGTYCLLIGSNFAGITVIAGLILAQEDYEGAELNWHQWMGIAAYILSVFIYFLSQKKGPIFKPLSFLLAGTVVLTGHFGANLTHGSDFLLAPIKTDEVPQVQLADAQVFRDMVQPILEAKCQSCHKEGKIKGELRLDHLEGIQKGGKSGPFILPGDVNESMLTQRIHLPKEEEEHMPPKNKEQLTEEEIEILTAWVLHGADFDKKVVELAPENELFVFASEKFSNTKTYSFKAADPELIGELNNFFRKVNPIYPESPALEVSYFGISAFDPESLLDLKKVKEQVVKLNLNKMPLENVDFSFLSDFKNLEEIQLNFADISNSQIESLTKAENLQSLAISGNRVGDEVIPSLLKFKNLRSIYAWQTDFSEDGKRQLMDQLKDVSIDFGFDATGLVYELNAPKLVFDEVLFQDSTLLEIKHPIGTVDIRYSLDGSEPDSIQSPKYTEPLWISNTSKISARVFANDWKGSDTESILLFKSGVHPSEIVLLKNPEKNIAQMVGRL
ncbi:c-type cytochrome domain-containing protein [Algoriphagus halophilus]|uniref:c-type cytochrome domain-containing protein n=1 Tax=Algoriphagus halophilus TaxID=226505 RepID=UPI00358F3C44